MITIRSETAADHQAIFDLTRSAFAHHAHSDHIEQLIIGRLRDDGALKVSLVAQVEGAVVGHVALSPVTISDSSTGWYGLGPLSVLPRFQGKGIGTALVSAGLTSLKAIGANGCVLLGEPDYYSRFGFNPTPGLSLEGAPPRYFQSIAFGSSFPAGSVVYHEAFSGRAFAEREQPRHGG